MYEIVFQFRGERDTYGISRNGSPITFNSENSARREAENHYKTNRNVAQYAILKSGKIVLYGTPGLCWTNDNRSTSPAFYDLNGGTYISWGS